MNNTVIGILVIAVLAIVAWLAYSQGYFSGTQKADDTGVQVQLGESSKQ